MTLALRHPGRWKTVSAFTPIASATRSPWGLKALEAYLGTETEVWREHDAARLIESGLRLPHPLIDVGDADPFLDEQLRPDFLEEACSKSGQPLTLRRQPGYDHSYYFIASFMAEHLAWHADGLAKHSDSGS